MISAELPKNIGIIFETKIKVQGSTMCIHVILARMQRLISFRDDLDEFEHIGMSICIYRI